MGSNSSTASVSSAHTFRIQQIDRSVSQEQLQEWLIQLCAVELETKKSLRCLSLTPHNGEKAATATFLGRLRLLRAANQDL
jgi:hypothetical protein